MAKTKVSLVKKSGLRAAKASAGMRADAFQFVDNGDSTCTVLGVDAAGNAADISALATIVASSADTTKVTVDPPQGTTFAMHAVGSLGTGILITTTATWNDGSIGPFTFDLTVDVVAGGVTGIQVVPGAVTLH